MVSNFLSVLSVGLLVIVTASIATWIILRRQEEQERLDNRHLLEKFWDEQPLGDPARKTMVVGHRGGFFGPENSMKGF